MSQNSEIPKPRKHIFPFPVSESMTGGARDPRRAHGANPRAPRGSPAYREYGEPRAALPGASKGAGSPPVQTLSQTLASRSVSAPPRPISRPPPLKPAELGAEPRRRLPASPSPTDRTTATAAPRRPSPASSRRRTPLPRGDRARLDVTPAPPTPPFTLGAPPFPVAPRLLRRRGYPQGEALAPAHLRHPASRLRRAPARRRARAAPRGLGRREEEEGGPGNFRSGPSVSLILHPGPPARGLSLADLAS